MLNYIVRRLLLLVPTLVGTTLVVFLVMALSPGGVGGSEMDAEGNVNGEQARAHRLYMERRFGLGKPLRVQYWRWLNHVSPVGFEAAEDGSTGRFRFLKMPDLGESPSKGRPVIDLVAEALPVTLLLNLITIPVTQAVSIATGILAARRRGGAVDLTTGFGFLALWSVPTILGGVLLIGYLANRQYVQLFPTGGLHDLRADAMPFLPHADAAGHWARGWLLDTCWHLCLPVACLTYGGFAFTSRLTRSAVLENMASDFARTAKAKGLADRVVLFRHVFRTSLISLITSSAGILPALLGGSLVVESIFSIHGMGLLMLDAIGAKDRELIMDQALIVGGLGLLANLLADLMYVVADPRVSYT